MNFRALGRSGLRVSPICFGGNVFGWTADEATSFSLLDAWVDAGMNFVDTADVYSRWVPGHTGGESETIIGKWLKQFGKRGHEAVCVAHGVGVMNFFALASGFLTGKYRSAADLAHSARGEGVRKYLTPKGLRVLDALDAVSTRLGATPAQVALAWQMARPSITASIASATSIAQLDELVAAARLRLDADAVAAIDAASA